MIIKLHCPECEAVVSAQDSDGETVCNRCGCDFPTNQAQRANTRTEPPPMPARTPRLGGARSKRNPDRERPRRPAKDDWNDSDPNEDHEYARYSIHSAAISLLALWLLVSLVGMGMIGMAVYAVINPQGNPKVQSEASVLVPVGAAYAVLVPIGMYGAISMVRGKSRGWSIASAILLVFSYPFCLPVWGVAIWVLVVLFSAEGREAFKPMQRRSEEF